MKVTDKCAKCGGAISEGLILDRGHYNAKQQQVWVEGAPEESFWKGLQTSGKQAFHVRAYRCDECGFLEFYTAEEADLGGLFN